VTVPRVNELASIVAVGGPRAGAILLCVTHVDELASIAVVGG
jgi:hypothetical protein